MNEFHYYTLKDKMPVGTNDVLEWGRFFQVDSNRRVNDTLIDDIRISTVFLGLEHLGGMFETMIFGGEWGGENEYLERCETWEAAETMHREAVDLVKMKR